MGQESHIFYVYLSNPIFLISAFAPKIDNNRNNQLLFFLLLAILLSPFLLFSSKCFNDS